MHWNVSFLYVYAMYILLRHIDKITLDMIILWSFVNVFMMDKLSNEDKMHIQTLCEQGLGAKAIRASYPDKNWSLSTLQTICHRVDEMGSAVTWRAGSGRPRSARTAENIAEVGKLICSQEDKPGTSKSSHQIARQLNISATSVRRIAKPISSCQCLDVCQLKSCRRPWNRNDSSVPKLCSDDLTIDQAKRVFFTDEKNFYVNPPVNNQNDRVWAKGRKEEEHWHEVSVNWTCKACPTFDGVCRSLLWRKGSTSLCRRKGQSERQLLRHQAVAKSDHRLQTSPVRQLRLSARQSPSSSCARLGPEELPCFQWKRRMATEFATSQSTRLSCMGHNAGMLSAIHTKADQHCRAKDCFVGDMEWFATGVHW